MKILKSIMISSILLCLVFSLIPVTMAAPNTSYIIHGQITAHDGSHPNGVIVTVKDATQNNETLTIATYTDVLLNDGTYQVDLGNMPIQWLRNDTILVSASYKGYAGLGTFNISASGTIHDVSFNLSVATHAAPGKPEAYNLIPGALGSYIGFFIVAVFAIAVAILFLNRKNK